MIKLKVKCLTILSVGFVLAFGAIAGAIAAQQRREYYENYGYYDGPGYYYGPRYYRPYYGPRHFYYPPD